MSVLIKGMEMPTSCFDCIESYQYKHSEHLLKWCCRLTGKDIFCGLERDANCPLIEIRPHGRLIDADELRVFYEKWHDDEQLGVDIDKCCVPVPVVRLNIDDAPTIIEAEKGASDEV